MRNPNHTRPELEEAFDADFVSNNPLVVFQNNSSPHKLLQILCTRFHSLILLIIFIAREKREKDSVVIWMQHHNKKNPPARDGYFILFSLQ